MTQTAAQIRQAFIDYFREHGHAFAPSSPVVPRDDPTLLFTNAGMNQFKDVFLGQGKRDYTRAANSQKCIRAGGKHNDLEDVGRDTYHHTFFEMLGNWSFGDYFKAEAIDWAWALLTDVWRLDPERMYVTVFEGSERDGVKPDVESEELWSRHVPRERISRWGKKDNFWEMGESGPCGPCSEIHYDATPDGSGADLVNRDDPRVIEIWNLVFIQFNRGDDGVLTPLPAKHVDTGMGLERVARIIQGKTSNYDTDLWTPIFEAIRAKSDAAPYGGRMDDQADLAYRVIADHIRCLSVAINDGAPPSNEGRGYVLRRILRRAVRHAHQTLGVNGPFLCELVPAVVESLGGAFPELQADGAAAHLAMVIHDEEESFLRTLDRGIALFDEAAQRVGAGGCISADDAFKLHDTYGFPIDLTRVMAEERAMTVDESGYETAMETARERSRAGGGETVARMTLSPSAIDSLEKLGVAPTDDALKYDARATTAVIKAIWNGRDFDQTAFGGGEVGVVLDRTSMYAEAGGQVTDHGRLIEVDGESDQSVHGLARFDVRDVVTVGGYVLHVGRMTEGRLEVGEKVQVMLDRQRRDPVMQHHTTTHLLNHALREVLGDGVEQKGSLVAPDRLRFDFSHTHAMTDDEVEQVERRVNVAIEHQLPVHADEVPLDLAMKINGVRAVFGERYPDPVRVVCIGASIVDLVSNLDDPKWREYSIEFCGGTHLDATGAAQRFVIVSEQGLAAGVRRITALAGTSALAAQAAAEGLSARITEAEESTDDALVAVFDEVTAEFDHLTLSVVAKHRLAPRMDALRERVKTVRKAAERSARTGAVDEARRIAEQATGPIVVERLDGADKSSILPAMDVIRSKCTDAAVMLLAPDEVEGKVVIAAVVPQPLIEQGLKAGDWVREAAKTCGGGGGGRPDMAQAGGKDPAKVPDAIDAARAFAERVLGIPT